ncbi:MAG: HAMP domain-containing sensor histidine kinase [Ignavibacteria bacterium]|nr:HAMP domain-containing sensor histidine kinase [Ignavibacteria bacterium]
MKLWIKLAILLTIIINIVIQVSIGVLTPKIEKYSTDFIGEKLKSIAASIAASIEGDEFNKLNIFDSTSINSSIYKKIQQTIDVTKTNLELSEDLYSISILDKNSLAFGVVLNRVAYGKDSLQQLSDAGKKAVAQVYDKRKCVHTDIYSDRYGDWLSGFAPIYDSSKQISGIIQVDQTYQSVKVRIDEIDQTILYGRLLLLPFTLLLSIILANFFLSPIVKVKEGIQKIASGDYSSKLEIKSSGEIQQLINAAETLRTTILDQQEKIFNNIDELKRAKSKAESSDRMKSEFLALLSHEIRTPLNIILGNIEVLKLEMDKKVLEELNEITNDVKYGSDRLIRTVEMIVLYSELASDSYNKKERFVNINQMFFELSNSYKEEAVKKSIKILNECTATTGMIKADEKLIEETIKQITDNAFKFTERGEIHFCIFDKNENGISLVIKDSGIGISEEFMKELYKPFRQEDMSYSRRFEGNGLGLAIAKKCCDANGFGLIIGHL